MAHRRGHLTNSIRGMRRWLRWGHDGIGLPCLACAMWITHRSPRLCFLRESKSVLYKVTVAGSDGSSLSRTHVAADAFGGEGDAPASRPLPALDLLLARESNVSSGGTAAGTLPDGSERGRGDHGVARWCLGVVFSPRRHRGQCRSFGRAWG